MCVPGATPQRITRGLGTHARSARHECHPASTQRAAKRRWQHAKGCKATSSERWATKGGVQDGDQLADALRVLELPSEPPLSKYSRGAWCTLHNLQSRPDLTGADVHLIEWIPPKPINTEPKPGDAVTYSGLFGKSAATITAVDTATNPLGVQLRLENGTARTTDCRYIQPCGRGRWKIRVHNATAKMIAVREDILTPPPAPTQC